MKAFKKVSKEIKLKKSKIATMFICAVLGVVIFIGLLYMESKLLTPNGVEKVVVAKSKIEIGQVIDSNNLNLLFQEEERDKNELPDNAITDINSLIGCMTRNELYKGNVTPKDAVVENEKITGDTKDLVETSIVASDIGQVVGGIVREGDLVNIGVIDDTTREYKDILTNVYVNRVFGSDGTAIEKGSNLPAVGLNTLLTKGDNEILNSAIAKGAIRISKVTYIPNKN